MRFAPPGGATTHNLWGSTEIGVQAVGCGQLKRFIAVDG